MAYNADGLQRLPTHAAVVSASLTGGGVKSMWQYVTNDTLATVIADAYFDGISGDPLVAGDIIFAVCDIDGTPTAHKLLVTVGGSDVTVLPFDSIVAKETTLDSAGEEGPAYGVVKLTDTLTFALADPIPGVMVTIVAGDSATNSIIPTDTDVLLDYAGNRKAEFDAQDEALTLLGVSATQFVIVSNVGSVTLGAS